MTPRIENVRPATAEQWDRHVAGSECATYFHSREWSEIWRDYTDGKLRPDAKIVEYDDGAQVLLPLTHQRRLRGVLRQYWLSPGETYGGWLASATNERPPIESSHVDELVRLLTQGLGRLFWKLNPFDPLSPREGPHLTEPDETMVLALDSPSDAIERGFSKGHRAAIRAAERDGVTVSPAANLDDWRGYYAAYEDTLRRWGDAAFTRHEWTFFEGLATRRSPNVRLWLARLDGEILGGALCFYASTHAVYWHGAAFEAHFTRHPMHAALAVAIRDANERGLRWFDFNPSGPLPGVRAFKKSFGATPLACPNVRVRQGMWREAARRGTGISPYISAR